MEAIPNHRVNALGVPVEEKKPKRKRRVLWLSDYACATGFAQVAHNVLRELYETGLYEFDVIGINYSGGHADRDKYPIFDKDFRLYPAWPQGRNDMFGRELLVSAISRRNRDIRGPWDLVFTLQDPFIMEAGGVACNVAEIRAEIKKQFPIDNMFKWIGYWPVDAPTKENWITKSVAQCDYPVAYCQYGYDEMIAHDQEDGIYEWLQQPHDEKRVRGNLLAPSLKDRLSIIRHGTNTKDFYTLPKEDNDKFREEYFGGRVKPDDFLIINVSRNQPRKDMARCIKIFADFQKKVPNSFLYLHARVDDVGGNLQEMSRHFDLDQNRWGFPSEFNESQGFPMEFINKLYNTANVCLSTTLGEGWGLMATEAMATKVPMVGPNITSFTEIFNTPNGFDPKTCRGIPLAAGSNASEWICLGQTDNERVRPLTNVDDAVSKLYWVYRNPDKVKEITDRAYKWATELTWKNECKKWIDLFDKAYNDLKVERKIVSAFRNKKPNRNDSCPVCASEGKDIKWKKCRTHNITMPTS